MRRYLIDEPGAWIPGRVALRAVRYFKDLHRVARASGDAELAECLAAVIEAIVQAKERAAAARAVATVRAGIEGSAASSDPSSEAGTQAILERMTVRGAADELDTSEEYVRRLARERRIDGVKDAQGVWRLDRRSVQEFVEQQRKVS